MAETYLCPQILALQAMLPSALKSKNKKWLTVSSQVQAYKRTHDQTMDDVFAFVEQCGAVEQQKLLDRFPMHAKAIAAAVREGLLLEKETQTDRLSAMTLIYAEPLLQPEAL